MKTGLQWILQEAKNLRKKYPKRFENWKQYVAQATAIYNSKNKSKSIGSLETFNGSFAGINFRIEMQKNFYGNTDAIVIDKNNKSNIVLIDGDKKKIENQSNQFYNYIERFSNDGVSPYTKKEIKSFVKLVSDDIALRNKKLSSTTKKTPAKKSIVKVELKPKIMKKAASKKSASKKPSISIKTALKPLKLTDAKATAHFSYGKIAGIFGSNMYSHRDNIEKILREKISLLDTHKKLLKSSVGSNLKLHHRQLITTLKNQIADRKSTRLNSSH